MSTHDIPLLDISAWRSGPAAHRAAERDAAARRMDAALRRSGRRAYAPGAFTVNVGDILARWTADRWRSTRHRVLPPPAQDPDEELVSLILFHEADMDTVVEPLFPGTPHQPVTAADYLRERTASASVPG